MNKLLSSAAFIFSVFMLVSFDTAANVDDNPARCQVPEPAGTVITIGGNGLYIDEQAETLSNINVEVIFVKTDLRGKY